MVLSTSPRYLRATLWTTLAVAVTPAVPCALSWPYWDVPSMVFYAVVVVAALAYAAVAFPAAARHLHRRQRLNGRSFAITLATWLVVVSVAFTAVVAVLTSNLSPSFMLLLPFLMVAAISLLTLPFEPLWLRLAR
jgi:hypothetical protein